MGCSKGCDHKNPWTFYLNIPIIVELVTSAQFRIQGLVQALCVGQEPASSSVESPTREEQLDHWMEQAYLMVKKGNCSPKEKRRRIMESLKGQALEVVKAVCLSDPDVTPERCLEAPESAFGQAESGDDLYFSFRLQGQLPGEKLSEFLRRLERCLSKVVQEEVFLTAAWIEPELSKYLRGL